MVTVPGKGGRPRKWLSDTDRVRAYRARQRGEPEPPTAIEAAGRDDVLAEALRREHELEALLIEANATTVELRHDLVAAEHAVVELEQLVVELERDRAELIDQVIELRERVTRPTAAASPTVIDRPGLPANRAARRRANRKRHK